MNFSDAIGRVFSNYANFNGRSRRSEFWYFILFYWGVLLALSLLAVLLPPMAALIPMFTLATAVPSLSVCWRRLHDVGRSGLWFFLSFLPMVGTILLIVWLAEDSQPRPNEYGPNPKEMGGWQVVNQNHMRRNSAHGPVVLCLSGPMQGQSFPVGSGILFGRDASCRVRFPEGTPGVSTRHCCLRNENGVLMLADLGSRHGTFLADGRQLPPNYPTPVAAGTRFYLGSSGIQFQIMNV